MMEKEKRLSELDTITPEKPFEFAGGGVLP